MSDKPLTIIGWRERISLPALGILDIKAKVDTGARTTALHAVDLAYETIEGREHVSFHFPQNHHPRSERVSAPVLDKRHIKNTSGVPEFRTVIETRLVIGDRAWRIECSLADREEMAFDIILGRTAIRRRRLLVAPGRSFLLGAPVGPTKTKRRLEPVPPKETTR